MLGAVLTFRDISERNQSEEERARLPAREQAAREQAEAANRAKDEFVAGGGFPDAPAPTIRWVFTACSGARWQRQLCFGRLNVLR